jgi:hypothetical protein
VAAVRAADIICQKVATEGLTRFEDRNRLPLGISVNLNSFSAKTLAQVRASSSPACSLQWFLHHAALLITYSTYTCLSDA